MAGALLAFGPSTAANFELCRGQVSYLLEGTGRPVKAVEVRLQHASGRPHSHRLWEVGGRKIAEVVEEIALHITSSAPSGATLVARTDG
jgi:hypothetical protein